LRRLTFDVAYDASSSCDDRLLLSLNKMFRVYVQDDVEKGRCDTEIPELIALGRQEFRQRCLEDIAGETMKDFSFAESLFEVDKKTDEVEVYLGYPVKLRDGLQLQSLVSDMTFFHLSDLNEGHLKAAEKTVKAKENADFAPWLAGWPAWNTVLQRVDEENFDLTQEKLMEAAGEPLQKKIESEREILDRPFCAVTYHRVSKRIWDEIVGVEKMKLTSAFLKENGLTAELAPFWNLKTLESNPEITSL
jgi:hypothetical protein